MCEHLSASPRERGLICVFRFSRNMQMDLMIRITGSFLSLISFAASVISEGSDCWQDLPQSEIVKENVWTWGCPGE